MKDFQIQTAQKSEYVSRLTVEDMIEWVMERVKKTIERAYSREMKEKTTAGADFQVLVGMRRVGQEKVFQLIFVNSFSTIQDIIYQVENELRNGAPGLAQGLIEEYSQNFEYYNRAIRGKNRNLEFNNSIKEYYSETMFCSVVRKISDSWE